VLTDNVISIGSVPAGPAYFIDVATVGQVKLRVHPVVGVHRAQWDRPNECDERELHGDVQ